MKRDFDRLGEGPFDLLVIGGGIHGAWMAYDAALRGLKACLVEKDDWASGTSSASSKLIHGGLRYLRYLRLGFVRKSLFERELLFRLGPHRIEPLDFVFPVYKDHAATRWSLAAGLFLYRFLAFPKKMISRSRPLSPQAWAEDFPSFRKEGFVRGFLFQDGFTDDARLTLEVVSGAVSKGAVAVNHARVEKLRLEQGRVTGAVVQDTLSARRETVRARVTINAAGAWAWKLLGDPGPSPYRLSRGIHLIMPRLPGRPAACVFPATQPNRVCFLIPWNNRTLLGTTDTEHTGSPDRLEATREDVAELLSEANRVLGEPGWKTADIIHTTAGLRVLKDTPGKPSRALTRDWFLLEPQEGLLMPIGGKLTTARIEASRVLDRVFELLKRPSPACRTGSLPFPWKPEGSFPQWLSRTMERAGALGMDEQTARSCALRYGTSVELIFEQIESASGLTQRVAEDLPFCLAEIVHAARHEMACTLADVLRRRVPLALLTRISRSALETAVDLLTPVLGWSAKRRQREISEFMGRVS